MGTRITENVPASLSFISPPRPPTPPPAQRRRCLWGNAGHGTKGKSGKCSKAKTKRSQRRCKNQPYKQPAFFGEAIRQDNPQERKGSSGSRLGVLHTTRSCCTPLVLVGHQQVLLHTISSCWTPTGLVGHKTGLVSHH